MMDIRDKKSIDINYSKIIGFFVHNRTNKPTNIVANFALSKFLEESYNYKIQHGDVIGLLEDEMGKSIHYILEMNGMFAEYVKPNVIYKVNDSVILHYIVCDRINMREVKNYSNHIINEWEKEHHIPIEDTRRTVFIKTHIFRI